MLWKISLAVYEAMVSVTLALVLKHLLKLLLSIILCRPIVLGQIVKKTNLPKHLIVFRILLMLKSDEIEGIAPLPQLEEDDFNFRTDLSILTFQLESYMTVIRL
jgi:hypothetical protein